ncbi:MAG: aldo/keto reductase [Anaerolineaceae bacterium]|nr:aldo/keto reductase [Anaerolineaceae bacterium]
MNKLHKIHIGTGTWAWGDRLIWSYGNSHSSEDLREAFQASLDLGINFFDTSEVYGRGVSESLLGTFIKNYSGSEPLIASKFMPFPWRLSKKRFIRALHSSLDRLQQEKIFLYQIHYPLPPLSITTLMDFLAEVYQEGLIENVGVSNFNAEQVLLAHNRLKVHGIDLVSNQVEYNLLNRSIETNGVLSLCNDLGIRVIAYSPLGMGFLSGKYSEKNLPSGYRARKYSNNQIHRLASIMKTMKAIANAHDGKNIAQVALNYCIEKGTLPIPGAKKKEQVILNAGTLDWSLTSNEILLLDVASST